MEKIKVLRVISKAKQFLDRVGIGDSPRIQSSIAYAKQKWFAEFYGHEQISASVDGLALTFPKQFAAHYVFRAYEPLTRQTFVDSLRPGMTVIDVGAHIGYFALLAAKLVGPQGKIYAVEPSQDNLDFLTINVSNNKCLNIEVHPVAAGRNHCTRTFQITGSSDSHGFYVHPNTKTVRTVEVQQRRLDEIVNGHVDAIKIDVEGAEIEVLEGMSEILAKNEDLLLWAEWFPAGMRNAGRDPSELPRVLRSIGFHNISVIDEQAKTIRTVEEIDSLLLLGQLPKDWYANIWARRSLAHQASL